MLVPVSRLGVASMRTHYHVKQDGRLAPGRQPRDAQPGRWPSGFPRSDQGPGGALCPAMGVSVGSLGRRASAGRSAGPKNAGVEWCHFQFPYYIYTRVRCYLIHTHTHFDALSMMRSSGRSMLHLEGQAPSPAALAHTLPRPGVINDN